MSASAWIARAKGRGDLARSLERAAGREWSGVGFSGTRGSRRARRLLPLLVFALVTALGVAALRIDLIRTRYALASVLAEENAMIEEQRSLIVRWRQLRDPVELAVEARKRGFRPLSSTLTLPEPSPTAVATAPRDLPAVATPPSASPTRSRWR